MTPPWDNDALHRLARRIFTSHLRWTGKPLCPAADTERELARMLFTAPFVLVAHGPEPDPVLNYGNAVALALWEMDWDDFTRTPSRLTAESPDRKERASLLAEVTLHGFIANYAGVRISKNGRRFRIRQATVWNVLDEKDKPAGQAATFRHWEFV